MKPEEIKVGHRYIGGKQDKIRVVERVSSPHSPNFGFVIFHWAGRTRPLCSGITLFCKWAKRDVDEAQL